MVIYQDFHTSVGVEQHLITKEIFIMVISKKIFDGAWYLYRINLTAGRPTKQTERLMFISITRMKLNVLKHLGYVGFA